VPAVTVTLGAECEERASEREREREREREIKREKA
jgi:hypothetical protein